MKRGQRPFATQRANETSSCDEHRRGRAGGGQLLVVDLQNGDLLVKRFVTDPFDGLLKIAKTRTATFEKKWVLGTSGTVRMTGFDDVVTLEVNTVLPWRLDGQITMSDFR